MTEHSAESDARLAAVIAEMRRWTMYPGDTREERLARAALAAVDALTESVTPPALPLHRTEANYGITCSTCDGGGCPDCTDPA